MKKCITLKLLILLSIVLILNNIIYLESKAALRGGAAKVNITPPVGIWLSGYGSRDKPSDAIEDELYAKAIVLDDRQN